MSIILAPSHSSRIYRPRLLITMPLPRIHNALVASRLTSTACLSSRPFPPRKTFVLWTFLCKKMFFNGWRTLPAPDLPMSSNNFTAINYLLSLPLPLSHLVLRLTSTIPRLFCLLLLPVSLSLSPSLLQHSASLSIISLWPIRSKPNNGYLSGLYCRHPAPFHSLLLSPWRALSSQNLNLHPPIHLHLLYPVKE